MLRQRSLEGTLLLPDNFTQVEAGFAMAVQDMFSGSVGQHGPLQAS